MDARHDEPGGDGDVAGLLAAASAGDERAWRELVARYGRRVYALAKSRCRSAELAEEVTQSVFVTVAAKLGGEGYAERGRFEPWLFRIAMNRVRDEMRRRKRWGAEGGASGTEREAEAAEEDEGAAAELGALRAALDGLSEADREVVELRHHGGLSFKQMADLLEEPVGTLLARHHRALRKLRAILEGNGEGNGEGSLPERRMEVES